MSITQPEPQIPRDRYGRPLVVPEGGGKPVAYTRATTFVDAIDDKTALTKWKQRMVALGLASRPDLLLGVTAADPSDKRALDKFCDDAMEAAKAHAAATTGTALHALTERIDRGQDVGIVPDAYLADLAAYTEATKDLTATHIEQFCVLDHLKVGGTPDRVVKYQGKRYIADVKTGSIEWGALKIAMQLAVYSRSKTYDHVTGERGAHDADLTRGIVIHLPAGTGTCTLHWIDLEAGWEAVKVAKLVREKRAIKFGDLTQPFEQATVDPAATPKASEEPVDIAGIIRDCRDIATLRNVWETHAGSPAWSDDLASLATARAAELKAAS